MAFASKKVKLELDSLRQMVTNQNARLNAYSDLVNSVRKELIERELDRAEDMKHLSNTLKKLKDMINEIYTKGHQNNYDWNADPENLTRIEGEIAVMIDHTTVLIDSEIDMHKAEGGDEHRQK
jgi:hypothetical protein